MARRRRLLVLGIAGLVVSLVTPFPGPVLADHGPGGADCPTELRNGLLYDTGSDAILVVLEGSGPPITYGDPMRYIGTLVPEAGADVAQEPVTIVKDPLGDPPETGITQTQTATTGDEGNYQSYTTPVASSHHHAVWSGSGACAGFSLQSTTVLVGVRVRMSILRSHLRPPAGFTFVIRGQVLPPHGSRLVTIQWKRVGSSTIKSASVTLNHESKYSKAFVSNTEGAQFDFRALYAKQDPDHLGNATPWVRVTIT